MIDEEDPIQLINNSLPISTDDIVYYSIPFWVLENILVNDISTFIIILKYWANQNRLITEQESYEIYKV